MWNSKSPRWKSFSNAQLNYFMFSLPLRYMNILLG